jgi:hypothetical protein
MNVRTFDCPICGYTSVYGGVVFELEEGQPVPYVSSSCPVDGRWAIRFL